MDTESKELLKTIARNTGPKESQYILASDRSTRIRTEFNPVLQLDRSKHYEMALVSLESYYSFPNIDITNDNFRYSPNNGVSWVDINIPEGAYEVKAINEYVQRTMKNNGHYDTSNNSPTITISANSSTLKAVLDIKAPYQVDFTTANSIRTVLGFNSQIYSTGYIESQNIVNILSVSSLRVMCDIIGASYTNGGRENVIYSFFPNVPPGYKIVHTPINLIYLPITLSTIPTMTVKLVDQNGKQINLRGEELSIRFHIREA